MLFDETAFRNKSAIFQLNVKAFQAVNKIVKDKNYNAEIRKKK